MGLGRVITLWRGVSAGLDRGDTPRDACVEHIFPISVVTQARRVHAHAEAPRSRNCAGSVLSGRHRCDQRLDADDIHYPRQILGEHVQRHLGCYLR